jgi:rhodanese-related sulfurtransferase
VSVNYGRLTHCLGLILLLAGYGGAVQAAAAAQEVSPQEIRGATKVSAEEVFTLFGKTPDLVIVDSRLAAGPSSGRANGYIEGSLSLPDTKTNCASLARIIQRKNTPSLYYCNGPKCIRSAKAIEVALKCGYTNIYWFRGGFEEWLNKGYPAIKP